jgi:hypothetical protein
MTCVERFRLLLIAGFVCMFCRAGFAEWMDLTDYGGTITASSQINEAESKEKAFDNTTATKWLTGGTATGWIQFQFPDGIQYVIGRYSIASANDAPERDPRNWTLAGSNDGANWMVVDTQVNQNWSGRFLRREFECANPGSFNIYRLTITSNNGSPNLTGFSEMELLGSSKWIDRTDYGGIITASSQIHEGESKEMAFDNTVTTKWLTYFTATGWIQFQFPQGSRYLVGKYSIASANDAPERDPKSWTLYGTNDEITWDVVDTRSEQSWTTRFQRREFVCANPGAYNTYRLDITSNNGSPNLTGFSEMELLEEAFIAENPTPADTASNIGVQNLMLSWVGPEGLSNPTYRIYLSPSALLVQSGDASVMLGEQTATSLLAASLDTFTTYYWRVDVLGNDTVYVGPVWRFMTVQPEIGCLRLLSDIDYDCQVGLSDLVLMASQWLSEPFGAYPADLDDSARVDTGDLAVLSRNWSETGQSVILSELMADNETTLADNFGEYSDWIEIKNLGSTPCNLQGWYLTDSKKELKKWAFPDVTLEARGMLIVFASERNLTDNPAFLHTNFKLGSDGEYVALVRPDGSIAHAFAEGFPALGNDESYGMTLLPGEETLVASLLVKATPGQDNTAAMVSYKPVYSQASGLFNTPFTVEISVPEPGCRIRYTTDGSIPTETSTLYTGPLTISKTTCIRAAAFKDKYVPGKTSTRSYLFLADAINQPALPEGFPSMWKNVAADYQMAPDVTTHATYGPLMEPSLRSLPAISIVTSLDNLFNASTGIYVNPLQEGVAWERPVSMEIIKPDNSDVFQIDCGLRIQGGAFRSFDLTRKKSFRLLFKRDYGPGKLNYPLFDDPDIIGLDTLVLRAGANDGYSWSSARLTEQYIRDEFGRSLQRDSGNAGAHGTFVHLYINGLYWGLYNAVERPDHAFGAKYYGGNKEDWDAINSGDVTNGDLTAWNTLLGKCRAGMTTMAAYQEILGNNPDGTRNPAYPVLIDAANYIDYMIINFWGGNGDWPWRNYWMGRLRTEDSTGFKFYCWDYESTIGSPFAVTDKVSSNNDQGVGELHRWLKENAEYRMLFGDRVHRLFFHGGIFAPDKLIARYSALADKVESSIVAESARWGDMHYQPSLGLNEWIAERNWVLNTYLPPRTAVVLEQMRANGLYPQTAAPAFFVDGGDQHGGYFNAGQVLSMSCPGSGYDETVLVAEGQSVRVHVPTTNALGLTWTAPGFVPGTGWTDGSTGTGVGYERDSGYESWIGTNVEGSMYNKSTSVFLRIGFNYDGIKPIEQLILNMKYDDGFIAYLNGTEVCRSTNISNDTPGSAQAANHEAGTSYESFDITGHKNLITAGTNVLAIHGINYSTTSSDMIVLPRLLMRTAAQDNTTPIWFTTDGSDPRLPGGAVNPAAVHYSGPLAMSETEHVKARSLNNGDWSALNEAVFAQRATTDNLRITEIMYHPADPNTEFIELTNIGSEAISLNKVAFTNGITYTFGDVVLNPGAYVVVVENAAAFEARYGTGVNVAGQYSGFLDNAGEKIRLVDAMGAVIHEFAYKDSWFDITDGKGFSLTIRDAARTAPELWGDKSGWRPSGTVGGSPGADDAGSVPAAGSVVINEVLAHSSAEDYDWIELYNTTDADIHIGGWYLSDNSNDDPNRMKYRIADGTIIKSHDYAVFYENLHFANPSDPGCSAVFRLSENGETVYLQSGQDGVLTGYYEEEDFGASDQDIAFGRHRNSTGTYNFVAMSRNTPGEANAYPKVGPVVITEIMYHPPAGGLLNKEEYEYVELRNISGSAVAMQEWDARKQMFVPWKFTEGIDYTFPPGVSIPAGGSILVVKNPTAFRERYPQVSTSIIYGPYPDTQLSNSGEKVELAKPGDEVDGVRYYIRVDRVSYSDGTHPGNFENGIDPWPTSADGSGDSLQQKTPMTAGQNYSNDAANWQAAVPTPGN